MNRCIVAAAFFVSAIMVSAAGCTSGTATVTSATPQDAFSTLQEAGKNKDWPTFLGCLTPQARDKMAGLMVVAGSMMSAGPPEGVSIPPEMQEQATKMEEAANEIKAVFASYGVSDDVVSSVTMQTMNDESKIAELGSKVSNQAGFIGAITELMEKTMGAGGPAFGMEKGTLGEVNIDGDSATGTITMDGRESPIEFKKINGSWLVEIPTPGG
ncbi:MAG: hypothetical protein ACR2NP_12760 [Pirellulaceae bacterium]